MRTVFQIESLWRDERTHFSEEFWGAIRMTRLESLQASFELNVGYITSHMDTMSPNHLLCEQRRGSYNTIMWLDVASVIFTNANEYLEDEL